MSPSSWRIDIGDCRDVLRSMPAQSVHTVVTSPPYFGLRDYGTEGQIGLEPTTDEFVATMVAVFREVRRVLRDDGTVWLNLGDSYASAQGGYEGQEMRQVNGEPRAKGLAAKRGRPTPGMKPKDLLGIPWLVAFALRADGWYLRSDVIWSKNNPMPESVTDRPTKAHEYVFLLSKGPRYHYDADAIREDAEYGRRDWAGGADEVLGSVTGARATGAAGDVRAATVGARTVSGGDPSAGRNRRSVWTVATQPYAGAHFATFPPKLIEPCILAGAPERACGECGAPWVRVVDSERIDPRNGSRVFEPSCSHGDGSARGVVLDPFAGAGTTGLVALQHRRDFVGIELNPEYAQMARTRIETAVRLGFRSPQNGPQQIPGQASIFDLGGDAA